MRLRAAGMYDGPLFRTLEALVSSGQRRQSKPILYLLWKVQLHALHMWSRHETLVSERTRPPVSPDLGGSPRLTTDRLTISHDLVLHQYAVSSISALHVLSLLRTWCP